MEFQEIIEEKQVSVHIKGLFELPIIPFQFRQLLHNLFTNAIKFSRKGVDLVINIEAKIAKGNKLNLPQLLPKANYCHFKFQDNGIGFEPKYAA